jgi:Phosphodiester glycosidase
VGFVFSMMRWTVLLMVVLAGLFSGLGVHLKAYGEDLQPKKMDRPTYQVVYVEVPPNSRYSIIPVVADGLDPLPKLVDKVKKVAVAAINAGFFDPSNKQTTSYITGGGFLLANPVDNRNFVENPDLYPYITDMLNRSEFRVMEHKGQEVYMIAKHRDPLKHGYKLIHSLQAGPNLFDVDAVEKEAFVVIKNNQRIRDPLGVDRKNARSAIGIGKDGTLILAMAAMKPLPNNLGGVTLSEMAGIMRELGATQALSLDGGSSTSFWMGGETYYGKLDKSENSVKRPIKSALVVIREE